MRLKNTNKRLVKVGEIIVKGLKKELKNQKHRSTGTLERSLKAIRYNPRGINGLRLDVISLLSDNYWQVVNNPSKWSFNASKNDIIRWAAKKGIPKTSAYAIYNKLMGSKKTNRRGFYGRPYVYWTEGNNLRRTDFAGYTVRKLKKTIKHEIITGIKQDAIQMVKDNIQKYIPNATVQNLG